MGKIGELIGNQLKYNDLYIKPIEMDGKWLGNGWGVSNLGAPLRGIPGRGLFCSVKSPALFIKSVFLVAFIIKPPFL